MRERNSPQPISPVSQGDRRVDDRRVMSGIVSRVPVRSGAENAVGRCKQVIAASRDRGRPGFDT
jgi:hypothetical protein